VHSDASLSDRLSDTGSFASDADDDDATDGESIDSDHKHDGKDETASDSGADTDETEMTDPEGLHGDVPSDEELEKKVRGCDVM
jgi:hypothetical protein